MPVVETTTGPVEGRNKEGTLLFAGIPYAAPPTGERRFKAAVAHEPWAEVRSAKRFGPAAPQTATGGLTASTGIGLVVILAPLPPPIVTGVTTQVPSMIRPEDE